MKKKNGFQLRELIIIVVITSILTSITTGVIMYNNGRITSHISGSDLSQDESLKEFLEVYASLVGEYYDDIDRTAMLEQAMKAMFDYLGEDYSNYLNKNETDALAEKLVGEYEGIGVQVIDNNVIYKVFADSPAERVGLQKMDRIVAINGENVEEKSTTEVASMIRESLDGAIHVEVLRNEERLSFDVSKETLEVPAISYQMVPGGTKKIGYLAISTFSNTVASQVKKALVDLESQGMEGLIIDVRDNTGGYLSQTTEICNLFLEKGKVIYSLAERDDTIAYRDDTDEKREYPIVVVMNDSTASASEILAAALRDSYGATLVGETTFGKGRVQQTHALTDGSMVKYTTARWLRPNGNCVDGVGIEPDVAVEIVMPIEGEEVIDTQLKEAITILNGN